MGNFFRIIVRPKEEFTAFRDYKFGKEGTVLRIAGKRQSGSWDTHAWLISKENAHMEHGSLVADTQYAQKVLNMLFLKPKHIKGDIFEARQWPDIPQEKKPKDKNLKARWEVTANDIRRKLMIDKIFFGVIL